MIILQVDSSKLHEKSTVPENCDGGAVENRLDPTPEAQVDLNDPTPRSINVIAGSTMAFCFTPSELTPSFVATKVTVGLVQYWPCIIDSVVYTSMGSMAQGRQMSTQTKLL